MLFFITLSDVIFCMVEYVKNVNICCIKASTF